MHVHADEDGEGSLSREELRAAVRKLSAGGGGDDDDEITLEKALHEWLGGVFLPTAREAAKKKKLMSVANKIKAAAAEGKAKRGSVS